MRVNSLLDLSLGKKDNVIVTCVSPSWAAGPMEGRQVCA